jgi:hypothetical protein
MVRVVLPILVLHIIPVDVLVDVDVLVHIDANVAVIPIEVVPDGVANGEASAPGQSSCDCPADDPAGLRRKVIRWVIGIGPRPIYGRRIVVGHINRFR